MKSNFKPIMKMFAVTGLVALMIYYIDNILATLPNYDKIATESPWIVSDLVHLPQFLIPFTIILYITKGKPSKYGFNLNEDPPIFTHDRMLLVGICFGLLMAIIPIIQALTGSPVGVPKPVTLVNILGYLSFQWVIVGLSEETMFRGLIQTYLMNNMSGDIIILGNKLHIGTLISAIFWGGFHIINVINMPFSAALLTVAITTPAGLMMGYVYQRTGSLFSTIIVHNTIFGVPLTFEYLLYFLGY